MRLVHRHVLDADAVFVGARLDDPIDEQERIAVRQQRQQLLDVVALDDSDRSSRSFRPPFRPQPGPVHRSSEWLGVRAGRGELLHRRDLAEEFADRLRRRARPSARRRECRVITPAAAATCAPAPIFRWPAMPAWPPSAAKSPITLEPDTPDCETSTAWRPTTTLWAIMHEIIDLRAFADHRVAVGAPVDRRRRRRSRRRPG